MNRRHLGAAALIGSMISVLSAGCSAAPENVGGDEAALMPPVPATSYDLAESCVRLFKRHESVRSLDLQQGVIRWGCGDVPGVTDTDLGQEYCEYQAVQNGQITKRAVDLVPGAPLTCVFTSVFTGAGQAVTLKAAMADPANLGTPALKDGIVQMQHGFNNRAAATGLLRDCSASTLASGETKRLRMAACYQAVARGGENAAALQQLCKTGNLSLDATWAQAQGLGAAVVEKGDPTYEAQRDIAGCMAVTAAGDPRRNSDPMICSRVDRTASECSCRFNAVPNDLMGIPFTGWLNDQLPPGCHPAKVNGADYPFIMICPVTEQEVADIPLNAQYSKNIANFCHDRFGTDLVMKFPLRAVQTASTCAHSDGFCSDYMSTPTPVDAADSEPASVVQGSGSRKSGR